MTDPRSKMAAMVANAILDASRQQDGSAVIDTRIVRQALSSVLAMILEAEPVLATPEALEEACRLFAAETLIQTKAMRARFEQTGQRPWAGDIVTRH